MLQKDIDIIPLLIEAGIVSQEGLDRFGAVAIVDALKVIVSNVRELYTPGGLSIAQEMLPSEYTDPMEQIGKYIVTDWKNLRILRPPKSDGSIEWYTMDTSWVNSSQPISNRPDLELRATWENDIKERLACQFPDFWSAYCAAIIAERAERKA